MTIPIYIAGAAILGLFLYRLLYGTDKPAIKGLPEIPGLPLVGSLPELGDHHAKVARGWAKKYGPVFQVRMGNRVSMKTSFTRDVPVEAQKLSRMSSELCLPTHSTRSDISGLHINRR